ncbi:enoyl-CoA hydratase/isomerase family protein [Nocardioides sp. dk4132]|uniref:enoyl-CoA hydratase/isomerase family protein n=1 Tax=unclassified Nocardioides TaxID=2615069 RepID=UPI0012965E55|nr:MULTISPECIES: enoyl-CoA hydratase/isomerase family protein [unclassified Nocardioides]MQW77613.1 enoyl-CoA hydratase/isomerase family protein [Nocardioides sp. dk4132]QGA06139.1 enoyl-CoA hydratase/isomerase family protein [Nocardioides sp. dk884]
MVSNPDPAVQLTEPADGVRLLTLNRAGIRNAMNGELTSAWNRTLDELDEGGETRCLVVTGAGSSFCAGADLSWLDQGSPDTTIDRLRSRMLPFYESWLRPRRLPYPVIAAVNGAAIGAGLCLALACDVRYASPQAVFSAPFIHLGTHAGMGATFLLPEAVGQTRAREMLFTGREVRAEQAQEWGLVSEVVPDVVEHAIAMATRIAAAGPIAARLTKTGLDASAAGLEAAIRWEALAQPVTLTTEDIHEGIEAFRAGRRPRFTGR